MKCAGGIGTARSTASCRMGAIRPDHVSEVCRSGDHLLAFPATQTLWNRAVVNVAEACEIAGGILGHHMTDFDRRRLMLAGAAVLLGTRSTAAQSGPTFTYRGIAVDTSSAQSQPDIKEDLAPLRW